MKLIKQKLKTWLGCRGFKIIENDYFNDFYVINSLTHLVHTHSAADLFTHLTYTISTAIVSLSFTIILIV